MNFQTLKVYEIFSEILFGDTSKPYSNLEIVYQKIQIRLQIGFEPIVTKTTVFAPNQKRLWRGLRNILAWHINSLTGQASRQLFDCYSYLTKGGNKIFLTNKNLLEQERALFPFLLLLNFYIFEKEINPKFISTLTLQCGMKIQ